MTQAYRLVKRHYARTPFDGEGAKRAGGRWNSKGVAMAYASDSIALAALELLVHLHQPGILAQYALCRIILPEDDVLILDRGVLPSDWRSDPPPSSTAEIGDNWFNEAASLALAVPSVIVPAQFNILINPMHPAFDRVSMSVQVEDFEFDSRLLKAGAPEGA